MKYQSIISLSQPMKIQILSQSFFMLSLRFNKNAIPWETSCCPLLKMTIHVHYKVGKYSAMFSAGSFSGVGINFQSGTTFRLVRKYSFLITSRMYSFSLKYAEILSPFSSYFFLNFMFPVINLASSKMKIISINFHILETWYQIIVDV